MDATPHRPATGTPASQMGCWCGENPLWDPDRSAVLWVDIPNGRVFRLTTGADGRPVEGAVAETIHGPGPAVGAVSLEADGALLLLGEDGNVDRWADGGLSRVHSGLCPGTRFNDCLADPAGRLFSGTMSRWVDGEPDMGGQLFRFDPDGSHTVVDEGFGIPNGMGFTPDGRSLYFTDTTPGRIYRYAYDPETGGLSDREVFFEEDGCRCDGMSVDAEGNLWSARWGGHGVWRHDPATGEAKKVVEVEPEATTAIAFAGPGVAYVTTARGNPDDPQARPDGTLYLVELPGVRGAPRHRSRVACG